MPNIRMWATANSESCACRVNQRALRLQHFLDPVQLAEEDAVHLAHKVEAEGVHASLPSRPLGAEHPGPRAVGGEEVDHCCDGDEVRDVGALRLALEKHPVQPAHAAGPQGHVEEVAVGEDEVRDVSVDQGGADHSLVHRVPVVELVAHDVQARKWDLVVGGGGEKRL